LRIIPCRWQEWTTDGVTGEVVEGAEK